MMKKESPHSALPSKKTRHGWTGFAGKTPWDWLQFLVQLLGALAIPLVVVLATNALNLQQQQVADTQHRNDVAIASDQQRETTLNVYLDDMSNLLLTTHLHDSQPGDNVRNIAYAKTFIALRSLDGVRKGIVLQFLYEAHLIDRLSPDQPSPDPARPIIRLAGVNLSGTQLQHAQLSEANLDGVDLQEANFRGTDLNNTSLRGANLNHAQLDGANLFHADLRPTKLHGTTLTSAQLTNAHLGGAHLAGVDLSQADLRGADLSGADLRGADLSGADLRQAKITSTQLAAARSLQGTIFPNGSRHHT